MARNGSVLAAAIALLSAAPVAADEPACELCFPSAAHANERPLQIELQSGLQFSRLGLIGRFDGGA